MNAKVGKQRLNARLQQGADLRDAGDFAGARALLLALRDDPEIDLFGPRTSLGLPRRLQSALLKLAKVEGDALLRAGYQYHLVPPPDVMEDILAGFARFTLAERQEMTRTNRKDVPRTIHQIWIGDLPVPPASDAWRIHAAAQGYRYKLWQEDDLAAAGLMDNAVFQNMLARDDYPGAVDVARYVILEREGGIYLDCDWFPARNDMSFHDILPMIGLSGLGEDIPRNTGKGPLLLANSVILTPPGHLVFNRLNAALEKAVTAMPRAPAWWITGPLIFTLIARGGAFTLADAALTAGTLGSKQTLEDVQNFCRANVKRDGGLLLAWKSW